MVTHRWAGIWGTTPDRLPLVGQVPGRDAVWIAGGYSGHGNALGLACGDLVARALLGERPEELPLFDPTPVRRLGDRAGGLATQPVGEHLHHGQREERRLRDVVDESPLVERRRRRSRSPRSRLRSAGLGRAAPALRRCRPGRPARARARLRTASPFPRAPRRTGRPGRPRRRSHRRRGTGRTSPRS